jgi:glutathione peroxidase
MIRLAWTMTIALAVIVTPVMLGGEPQTGAGTPPVLNFTMNSLDGKPVNLSKYRGRVVLMVNVASECGYTPQYAGLQELHQRYAAQGLSVLGFPANEFGGQEPGTNAEIAEFCSRNYGVQFDMFSKIIVRGNGQHPLYRHLTAPATNPRFAGDVSWNFEKFLVGRDGQIIGRFLSAAEPLSREVVGAIESALSQK